MFRIESFESIYNLIEKNDNFSSQRQLALFRKKYALHPDYLFLMSKYLILDKRYYQSIDALLGSLKYFANLSSRNLYDIVSYDLFVLYWTLEEYDGKLKTLSFEEKIGIFMISL